MERFFCSVILLERIYKTGSQTLLSHLESKEFRCEKFLLSQQNFWPRAAFFEAVFSNLSQSWFAQLSKPVIVPFELLFDHLKQILLSDWIWTIRLFAKLTLFLAIVVFQFFEYDLGSLAVWITCCSTFHCLLIWVMLILFFLLLCLSGSTHNVELFFCFCYFGMT